MTKPLSVGDAPDQKKGLVVFATISLPHVHVVAARDTTRMTKPLSVSVPVQI